MSNFDSEETKARIARARSLLFVPGDQPMRMKKALASNAEGVIIDFEDAVAPENRQHARALLKRSRGDSVEGIAPLLIVRVNSFGTPDFHEDIKSVLDAEVEIIMVPKFVAGESAKKMEHDLVGLEVDARGVTPLFVIALIESAAGVLSLLNSSYLPPRILRFAFGAVDFHADLGTSHLRSDPHTDLAHSALVLASAAASLGGPLDSPYLSLDDDGGLRESARTAREKGFGGKLAIHPNQILAIQECFQMSTDQLKWANRVLAGWDSPARAGRGAISVDGQLVDAAMVRRARQIMANQ